MPRPKKVARKVAKKPGRKPARNVVQKPKPLRAEVGGVYLDGEKKRIEIVGKLRGTGGLNKDFPFLGIVRNKTDNTIRSFNKFGHTSNAESAPQYNLVKCLN